METSNASAYWRKCSSCKNPIALGARYYVCSVSTCNSLRTNYVFCSVHCFERHLPGARHKDAAAIEKQAPMTPEPIAGAKETAASGQRLFAAAKPAASTAAQAAAPREVLVIASRLKDYVTARSEFNTSGSVMDVLSDHLRSLCDRAIEEARSDGRKTIMDRDFSFLKR